MSSMDFYVRWIKRWTVIRNSTVNPDTIKRANKHIQLMTRQVKEFKKILYYMKGRYSHR